MTETTALKVSQVKTGRQGILIGSSGNQLTKCNF
jgi:hypothetical protein